MKLNHYKINELKINEKNFRFSNIIIEKLVGNTCYLKTK